LPFLRQPQQQYGSPAGPGYGGPIGVHPPGHPGPGGMAPLGHPGSGVMHSSASPRMGPPLQGPLPPNTMSSLEYSGSNIMNGPGNPVTGPSGDQNMIPPQVAGPHNQPPPRGPHGMTQQPPMMGSSQPQSTNQLANQMSGMNLGGPPRPQISTTGFPGGPPMKPGLAGMPPGAPPNNFSPPGSFPPTINGGPPPTSTPDKPQGPPGQQGRPPPTQYMNGSMGPSAGPGRGPMGPPPGGMPPPHSSMPPPHGSMPPSGNMPSLHTGIPSHPGGMPPPPGGMPPPHTGMPPPHTGGMPPPTGGMPPPHTGMPPPTGGMPPPHTGMPPPPGGMPPSSMHSHPGAMPPQPGGMQPHFQQAGMQSGPTGKQFQPSPDMYHGAPQMSQPPMGPQGPNPNYQSHQPMSPQQPTHPGLQSQPARRLDPDQMPSPIQVMQDDQRNRSGIFYTNQKGLVPPLVTTQFVTQDQGNASPRYIRSTMYNVPATIDMMKQTAVPFGLVLSPLAVSSDEEYPPPIVNMGEIGPVRCNRCKAYMCPFMQFIDGGRRFHCLFCKATTEVPAEYFQHLDHTGHRFERPELMLGAYEFVATKDYCRNNTFPKPPALICLIDVSYNNIKSGMVHLLCSRMKEIVKLLPKEDGAEKSSMKVGFITYNNMVHFYNIKGCLAQPQMMVVGDVQDMFMPLLDGFLCDPIESETVIDSLMEQIPAMFADTRETETVLAPAIQAGLEALKASECAGKLLVFHSSLPIAEAPGKLKNRDDRKLLGTEKEKTVLAPQVNVYNNLGQECVGAGCSVDLFVFNNSYIDVATIGQVARLTGGEVYKYTYFQADLDGERLITDIKQDVSRPIAFDAIMRVRTSTGVRATDFFGHFFMSNTTDMELASIDCDKAVAVEIKHDDKLTEEDGVYLQVALLYTSCGGQRRLRILNLSLKACSQMADLYRSCEIIRVTDYSLIITQTVFRLLESSPKPVKENLVNRCAQMLACYRKNCASPSSSGQLILPECMKLLPLYVNCILKSDAISGVGFFFFL
ncbi:hypothetical protein L9F63_001785, partial [Diploptera punctata]